jgi:hypothetical protein
MSNNRIVVDPERFKRLFKEFTDLADEQIEFASEGVGVYISDVKGTINLDPRMQERGVYLATAHILKLETAEENGNGSGGVNGLLASATEGDVSASFTSAPIKDALDFDLYKTKYGQQLLILLKQVQPPLPRVNYSIKPFYGVR